MKKSKRQILEKKGRLPDYVIACGWWINAIGAFSQYVRDEEVKLVGVEQLVMAWTQTSTATMTMGTVGVVDG